MAGPYDTLRRFIDRAQAQGDTLTLSTGDPEADIISLEGQPVTADVHSHLVALRLSAQTCVNLSADDLTSAAEDGPDLELHTDQGSFTLTRVSASGG